uniref:Uncharacterized protein n=1 Tax=viral metagenome TaxID=1070528 RepID=A0A6C0JXN5_9ZZZZ
MSSLRYLFISFPGDADPLITSTFEGETSPSFYSSIYVDKEGRYTEKVDELGPQFLNTLRVMVSDFAIRNRTYYLIRYGKEGVSLKTVIAHESSPDEKICLDTTHLSLGSFFDEEKASAFHDRIVAKQLFPNLYSLNVRNYKWLNGLVFPSVRVVSLEILALSDIPTILECDRLEELEIRVGIDDDDLEKAGVHIDMDIDILKCDYRVFVRLSKFINLDRVGRLKLGRPRIIGKEGLLEAAELSRYIPVLEIGLPVLKFISEKVPEFYHPNLELLLELPRLNACLPVLEAGKDFLSTISYGVPTEYYPEKSIMGSYVQVFYFDIERQPYSSHLASTNAIHPSLEGDLKKVVCRHPRGHVTIYFDPPSRAKSARKVVELE